MANNTREKIMLKAVEMFNRNSASNVSTVQLANELNISPGNLYYYFDNKEHLIRAIWEEFIAPESMEFFYDTDFRTSENGIISFLTKFTDYSYKYRFFYLELHTLLRNDPMLNDIYTARSSLLADEGSRILDSWIALGIVKDMNPFEKRLLRENCFALGHLWITYTLVRNPESTPEEIANILIIQIYSLLSPSLTEMSYNRFTRLLEINGYIDILGKEA